MTNKLMQKIELTILWS